MHLAARADALHNFLAQVAAFIEVQRARLRRFLRQVFLPDVHAKPWHTFQYAQQLEALFWNKLSTLTIQRLGERGDCSALTRPNLEVRHHRTVSSNDR